ncbi:MAG: hypothetical protein Q4D81_12600 [Eubacteriales bacterium]|nr:hypothetical protein [Eubacteriales bacterium]
MNKTNECIPVKRTLLFFSAALFLFICRLEAFADVIVEPNIGGRNEADILFYVIPILLIILLTIIGLKIYRGRKNGKK